MRGMQGCDNTFQYREGILRTVAIALLEIHAILSHGVCHVGHTEKWDPG